MKITDKIRLDWLADCTVGEGNAVFDRQFQLINFGNHTKREALRKSIDMAIDAKEEK